MKKALWSIFCLFWTFSAVAETEEAVIAQNPQMNEEQKLEQTPNLSSDEKESQPFEPIVYEVEKEIYSLPDCNDITLLAKTKEFLTQYYAKSNNQGVLFRRRRHFILNSLENLTEENVANYKTQDTRPVSDVIISLKVNQNVLEENIRLCKKELINKVNTNIYLIVYPVTEGYKVFVLNLDPKHETGFENSFVYSK